MRTGLAVAPWVASWLILTVPAAAQGLRPDVLLSFGGRYASDCSRPDAPQVLVGAQQMRIEQGQQRLTATQLDAAFSYFGNSPPPGYRLALLGQVQGHELLAIVSGDRQGQYLQLDGDRQVVAKLGALAKLKFRHCNEAANQRAAADRRQQERDQAAARAPVAPGTARSPSELIRDPRFKPAYLRALGSLAREAWLVQMDGPAKDLRQQRIAGVDYTVAGFCKPHDCQDNSVSLLYDAAQGRVYGLLQQKGRMQSLGSPPGPLLIELNAIWRRDFRQGR